jgi:cysteinyl-tRNA synthetase
MQIQIYNSLSGKKEIFEPLVKNEVKIYLCGPTVYDLGHLGHARSAISFDTLRRFLAFLGYKVTFVSNYTDIDDKMIERAEKIGITVDQLAKKIIPEYEKDYGALGILPADKNPCATEYVTQMISATEKLLAKNIAYEIPNDGIYFEVAKFPEYGKLSKQKLDELIAGTRVEVLSGKKSPHDFVLWKFKKEGEPFWEAPFGAGRPGWHIECSCMIEECLGETIDIHAGGIDLKFPHHECEIAQHEAIHTDKKLAKYWMHNGFVQVDSEKMSKSLNNFFTIREILEKFDPMVVRFFLLQKHYGAPVDFSDENLQAAANAYTRITDFLRRVQNSPIDNTENQQLEDKTLETKNSIIAAMADDLQTPKAFAAIFDFIKNTNSILDSRNLSQSEKDAIGQLISDLNEIFGVFHLPSAQISAAALELIEKRNQARIERNWQLSDSLRDELLQKHSIAIEDTPKGSIWKKV